jgi:hypothetical protein
MSRALGVLFWRYVQNPDRRFVRDFGGKAAKLTAAVVRWWESGAVRDQSFRRI